ncbi:hypothetical protein GCM10027053_37830 [Intrasporangium mesophilum]
MPEQTQPEDTSQSTQQPAEASADVNEDVNANAVANADADVDAKADPTADSTADPTGATPSDLTAATIQDPEVGATVDPVAERPTAADAETDDPPPLADPADAVTEINPDVDIAPEDIGPTVAEGERILEVDNVTLRFGGVVALNEVSFHINKGEILGLIGPNGAGKTTCFNVMTGVYQPTSGGVRFLSKPLGKRKKFQITKLGIARTFQNIRLFANMTALENVLVGVDAHHTTGVGSAMFRLPKHRREEEQGQARALELLEFMGLENKADELARNLPYGDQRRLEIARALATSPQLLCLDEPAAGFNPAEKAKLMDLIRSIRDQGYTVLLIEHDMRLVMGVTDRIVVLEFGRKIAEGAPAEIRDNPAVIAAYLGVDEEDAS